MICEIISSFFEFWLAGCIILAVFGLYFAIKGEDESEDMSP